MAFFITEATNNKKTDLKKVPFLEGTSVKNGELDLSDYLPKRFGLKYDPPTIGKPPLL